jgi:hypothetical protein
MEEGQVTKITEIFMQEHIASFHVVILPYHVAPLIHVMNGKFRNIVFVGVLVFAHPNPNNWSGFMGYIFFNFGFGAFILTGYVDDIAVMIIFNAVVTAANTAFLKVTASEGK